MSATIFDDGFLRMTVRYVKALRGGTFYYYRRIPKDVKAHFPGKTFRKVSLGTKDLSAALRKAGPKVDQDDALWKSLRSPANLDAGATTEETRAAASAILDQLGLEPGAARRDYPAKEMAPIELLNAYFEGRHGEAFSEARHSDGDDPDDAAVNEILSPAEREAVRLVKEDPANRQRLLSEALEVYLENHPKGERPSFAKGVKFAISQAIEATGDLPLQSYRRADARKVRDHLLARDTTTTTVRRRLTDIVSVFNAGLVEFDLQKT
ncbi:MAG: DUF6538 domain-containing protein, partial [Hyphomicrobiales bacterium]